MAQEIGDVVGLAKPVTEKRLEFYRKWNRLFLYGETALIRLITFVGPLYFVDVIWGTVSLHAWLYLSSGVAVFYSLSYFTKKLAWRST